MTVTLPGARTPEQAFDLVSGYRAQLAQAGYKQTQVDTMTSGDESIRVRIGYSGGEWRVTVTIPGNDAPRPWTIKIDWRHQLPTMEQLMEHTVHGIPSDKNLDAKREMCLRGAA